MPTEKSENKANENAFDDFLNGKSDLSKQYHKEITDEPAGHIDDKILSTARRSVNTDTENDVYEFIPRSWFKPVSVAAVMVLAVGVLFSVYDELGQEPLKEPLLLDSMPANQPMEFTDEKLKDHQDNTNGSSQLMQKEMDAPADKPSHPSVPVQSIAPLSEQPVTPDPDSLRYSQEAEQRIKSISKEKKEDNSMLEEESMDQESVSESITETFAAPARQSFNVDAGQSQTEQEWISEISQLWVAGENEKAITLLQKFQKAYPDYPTSELRQQLPLDMPLTVVQEE